MYWIAFGDLHENTVLLDSLNELKGAEGVIISGDITNAGGADTAERIINDVRQYNSRIYAQIGNMDHREITEYLRDEKINIHLDVIELADDLCIAGIGCSTPTPFNTPSEVSEQTLEMWLGKLKERVSSYKHCIFVCHTPPYETSVDKLESGVHVGSPAVRAFIEEMQPEVFITGHIHESRAEESIGRTKVINPGMLAHGGFVKITFKDGVLDASLEKIS